MSMLARGTEVVEGEEDNGSEVTDEGEGDK
jgi:hypothetical protein